MGLHPRRAQEVVQGRVIAGPVLDQETDEFDGDLRIDAIEGGPDLSPLPFIWSCGVVRPELSCAIPMETVYRDPTLPLILKVSAEGRLTLTVSVTNIPVVRLRLDDESKPYFLTLPRSPETLHIQLTGSWRGTVGSPYSARIELEEEGRLLHQSHVTGSFRLFGDSTMHWEMIVEPRPALDAPDAHFLESTSSATDPHADGDRAEYLVWYATNRRRVDESDVAKGYSSERGPVEHGSCRVFIPKSHKIGSIGSPWWKRLVLRKDDRLRLLSIEAMSEDEHWQGMQRRVALAPEDERHAILFIHGYNVSFEDASLRAAQIGFDLSIRGAMAFFSWPSQGTLRGYLADAASIEASEHAIERYLVDFATRSGATTVNVIAHSMGNRALLRAVNRITTGAHQETGIRFRQIVLAAADVDADTFRALCAAYGRIAQRTTLYVSASDRAVEASGWLHQFARAGFVPPVLVTPGIDTINVTNVDLTMLGHGYVGEARDVLRDMHALIRHDDPPPRRFGMREARTTNGESYWLLGA